LHFTVAVQSSAKDASRHGNAQEQFAPLVPARWIIVVQHPVLRPLKQVVDLLEVHCPNASDGCSFTFPYGSLEQHLKTCEFAKVPCPYACFGCSTIATPRWRLWAHLLSNADRHNKFQANAAQVQCAGEITQPERWPEKDGHQRMPAGMASKTHYYLKQLQNPPHEDNWKLASADPRLVASAGRSSRRKEKI